jgi:hypothetical protein
VPTTGNHVLRFDANFLGMCANALEVGEQSGLAQARSVPLARYFRFGLSDSGRGLQRISGLRWNFFQPSTASADRDTIVDTTSAPH